MATLRRVLLTPIKFFECLPLTGGLGEPFGFALLVGTTGVLSSLLWQLILEGDFSGSMLAVAFSKQIGNLINDPRVVIGVSAGAFFGGHGSVFSQYLFIVGSQVNGTGKKFL